jgi:hypothetical protein
VNCAHCGKPSKWLTEHPAQPGQMLCRVCDITVSKQFPGVNGLEYANEVDPSNPDPEKALEITLKELTQTTNERNRLTDSEAQMIMKVHRRDFRAQKTAQHAIPDRTIEMQRERIQQMTADDLWDNERRKMALKERLGKMQSTFEQAKSQFGKGKPNEVVDIP